MLKQKINSASSIIKSEEGYALVSVLMITLLIVSFLLSLLSVQLFKNVIEIRQLNSQKLDLACYSAIQHKLNAGRFDDQAVAEENIKIDIAEKRHGLYEEYTVTARNSYDSARVSYLVGYELPALFDNALVWTYPNLNGMFAGSTVIKGNILASTGKISSGRIQGVQNSQNKFHIGKTIEDRKLNARALDDKLFAGIINPDFSGISYDTSFSGTFVLNDKSMHELKGSTNILVRGRLIIESLTFELYPGAELNIYAAGSMEVSDNSEITTRLNITADSKVRIGKNCRINNLLLAAADSVIIVDECVLSGSQLYSLKSISIKNSLLEYPSVIGVYAVSGEEGRADNFIQLESTTVNGTVMLGCSEIGLKSNGSKIIVDGSSVIHGLCYSENLVEMEGTVKGVLMAYKFRYYKEPTEYINWIVNARIDRLSLDEWFLLPAGFIETNERKILKETWIY